MTDPALRQDHLGPPVQNEARIRYERIAAAIESLREGQARVADRLAAAEAVMREFHDSHLIARAERSDRDLELVRLALQRVVHLLELALGRDDLRRLLGDAVQVLDRQVAVERPDVVWDRVRRRR